MKKDRTQPTPDDIVAALDVEVFFTRHAHPHTDALRALRRIILGADTSIFEGIKWNVPSFRTTEYFATLHVRAKVGVGVILHFGAKKRGGLPDRTAIADPEGILAWLADDRAVAHFTGLEDVEARGPAFAELIRQWIRHV